jgi:hypothetical protein
MNMAGIKGRSGGKRDNTRIKSKLSDPKVQADWKFQLKRAICSASSNMGVLRKDTFYGIRELSAAFGKKAVLDFKDWFEASKHFNQQEGDRLYQEFITGRLEEKYYKKFLHTKAHFWVWSLRPEKQTSAWEISRGLREF